MVSKQERLQCPRNKERQHRNALKAREALYSSGLKTREATPQCPQNKERQRRNALKAREATPHSALGTRSGTEVPTEIEGGAALKQAAPVAEAAAMLRHAAWGQLFLRTLR